MSAYGYIDKRGVIRSISFDRATAERNARLNKATEIVILATVADEDGRARYVRSGDPIIGREEVPPRDI